MNHTQYNMNMKAILAAAGTLTASTSAMVHAEIAQSPNALSFIDGLGGDQHGIDNQMTLNQTGWPADGRGGDACGGQPLSQSDNPSHIDNESVWCGTTETNDETSLARSFVAPGLPPNI